MMSGGRLLGGARDKSSRNETKARTDRFDIEGQMMQSLLIVYAMQRWNVSIHGLQHRLYTLYTHRIDPFSFPHPISSPPTQNGLKALGRSSPSISSSCSSTNLTPFSRRATSNRGIAAAVPLSVCANGSGASVSVAGRYRICRRRD